MTGKRGVITAIVVLVLIAAGWWVFGRGRTSSSIDLLETFPQTKKQPDAARLQIVDATVNGETKRAIVSDGATRITWSVRVPDDAWLRVDVAMQPDTWQKENQGTYFFVVVSDGRNDEMLFSQHVHPFANEGDRKWMPAFIDLSAYAGEQVDLIFNVRSGVGGKSTDFTNIVALWGAPAVVVR
jgi:hypothetical protein